MVQTETSIGWQDYLTIVFRRRWYFLIPCALIVIAILIVGFFLPKIYRAETLLLVEERQVMNPLIQGLVVSTSVDQRMRILREELLSWTSLSRLVTELGLDKGVKSPLAFERLIKRLQKDITVKMRGHDLVTVSYEEQNPHLAQKLVNTITNLYMERNIQSQSTEAETAISFIEKELAIYRKKLEDSEKNLRDFKELYITQMPVANELNQQIIQLEIFLAGLLVDNTEQHPTVVQTKRRIQELREKRNSEIRRVVAQAVVGGGDSEFYQQMAQSLEDPVADESALSPTVRTAREAYRAWVERLDSPSTIPQSSVTPVQVIASTPKEGEQPSFEVIGGNGAASVSLGPRQEQELARLTRDYQVNQWNYNNLSQRLERAKITQRLGESDEGTKFKVLEPARLPLKPIRPNFIKLFFLALFLGMSIGAGVAFIAEYLDQSFQSAEELEAALAVPVLGSISTIVTEGDIEARRTRLKTWVSWKIQRKRFQDHVVSPIWSRIDRVLVRLGL